MNRDILRLTCLEMNPVEGRQRVHREIHAIGPLIRSAKVDLRYFIARDIPVILDLEANVEASIRRRNNL